MDGKLEFATPVPLALRNSVRELNRMRGLSLRLEVELIAMMKDARPDMSPARRQVYQDFDLLGQSIEGLSQFLVNLAMVLPHELVADLGPALRSLTLNDMRERLSLAETRPDGLTCDEDVFGKVVVF